MFFTALRRLRRIQMDHAMIATLAPATLARLVARDEAFAAEAVGSLLIARGLRARYRHACEHLAELGPVVREIESGAVRCSCGNGTEDWCSVCPQAR